MVAMTRTKEPMRTKEARQSPSSSGLLTQRLLALFFAGLLLLNFPLLVLAIGGVGSAGNGTDGGATLLGLPRLPLLLFVAFAALIALVAVLMERDDSAE